MIENAAVQGERFLAGLQEHPRQHVREVRGRGLMLAVELHPEAGGARRYCEALQARGSSPRTPTTTRSASPRRW